MAQRYWIGVAVQEHVMVGAEGGFCQLGHGKHRPVKRLSPVHWLTYYAPRITLDGGDKVQAFVALGQVQPGEPYQVTVDDDFAPWRRDVTYYDSEPADVRPLLEHFSFIDNPRYWGLAFRRSLFEVQRADFEQIADAMGVSLT